MPRVKLNKSEVKAFARNYARDLVADDTTDVKRLARVAAKGSHPRTTQATGFLSRHIESKVDVRLFGKVTGTVGVNRIVTYQMPAHNGANPHRIVARHKPELSFWWRSRGRHFQGPKVSHPGMDGKKYLTGPLVAVCGRPTTRRGPYRIIIF